MEYFSSIREVLLIEWRVFQREGGKLSEVKGVKRILKKSLVWSIGNFKEPLGTSRSRGNFFDRWEFQKAVGEALRASHTEGGKVHRVK